MLDRIEEDDEMMSASIRDLLFVFDNLLTVTDRHMQRLLQEVGQDKLVIALKRRLGSYEG